MPEHGVNKQRIQNPDLPTPHIPTPTEKSMCDLFHFIQSDYIFETMISKNMLQL